MAKFRKKPVEIEAVQWKGLNLKEVQDFCPGLIVEINDTAWQAGVAPPVVHMSINTLEGEMKVSNMDYVIKGIQGEFYPCKPDIFEATYEFVRN